jgi:hypothetical protein
MGEGEVVGVCVDVRVTVLDAERVAVTLLDVEGDGDRRGVVEQDALAVREGEELVEGVGYG